jgi:hypothetical protein
MTKKDYIIVANAIKQTNSYHEGLSLAHTTLLAQYVDVLLDQLAMAFQRDNHRFNEQKFKEFINAVF